MLGSEKGVCPARVAGRPGGVLACHDVIVEVDEEGGAG